MTSTSDTAPPAAEAARSTVLTSSTCVLWTDNLDSCTEIGVWVGDAVGDLLLALAPDDPLIRQVGAAGVLPLRVELLDAAPAVMRDRIRSRLLLTGWATVVADPGGAWAAASHGEVAPEDCGVLHIEVIEVRLDDEDVDPDAYRDAEPDPLASCEIDLLLHLVSGHAADLTRLSALLPCDLRLMAHRVVPLRLHRRALVLRAECGEDDVDVVLPFGRDHRGEPPSTPGQILAAARRLMTGSSSDAPRP